MACKHGNFEMVKFLLSEGANPHLKSQLDREDESLLQVCARWSHSLILDHLLSCSQWSKDEVGEALALPGLNFHIRDLLRRYSRVHFGMCFNLYFRCLLCCRS